MKHFPYSILIVLLVIASSIMGWWAADASILGQQSTEQLRNARILLAVIPFLAGILVPRHYWISALAFTIPQSLIYLARFNDPLVAVSVVFVFVVSFISAGLGAGVRALSNRYFGARVDPKPGILRHAVIVTSLWLMIPSALGFLVAAFDPFGWGHTSGSFLLLGVMIGIIVGMVQFIRIMLQ